MKSEKESMSNMNKEIINDMQTFEELKNQNDLILSQNITLKNNFDKILSENNEFNNKNFN